MATVFTTTTGTGRKQQVFPVRVHGDTISQQLVDAAHADDLQLALELVSHPTVDVNFIGTVSLKSRKTEVVLNGESASEVRIEFDEFRTDVTALFLAAHNGNVALVRKLLNVGANINQKLFRGYATTATVREGHIKVLEILLNGGSSQAACEEALLEACYLGRSKPAQLLMECNMIRPRVAVHALVTASSRGFVDFVETLIKNGVDANAYARILLQSSKPSLHANVDCNALAAAVITRQVSVVQLLLKFGCRTDTKVSLGAWSWDVTTGEEFRVGAGLAEPYHITWCAVEYFESTGLILRMLLQYISPNVPHLGRTIIHHAILCGNARAIEVLLSCGAHIEFPIETTKQTGIRPIHLASRLGSITAVRLLITSGCNVNSQTGSGETALMICARHKHEDCLKLLASAGADFGLFDKLNQSTLSVAGSARWTLGFQRAVLDVIRAGKTPRSSNSEVFSSIIFATRANDLEALTKLIRQPDINLDEKDESGFSAVMAAAAAGNVESFRLLVNAGADVETRNNYGESARSLAEANHNSDAFREVLKGKNNSNNSYPLHQAARTGKLETVKELVNGGYDVNILDGNGHTPLMLAAGAGNGRMCCFLLSRGAKCDDAVLSFAKRNEAEGVILDELARKLVLGGACVKKHTRAGKGAPHMKTLSMVDDSGVLRWGKSRKRNVICRGAEVGPSSGFGWNRRKKRDVDDPGVFRVVTVKNREIHFSCQGGVEMARLWVRGIRVVTREAIFGTNLGDL